MQRNLLYSLQGFLFNISIAASDLWLKILILNFLTQVLLERLQWKSLRMSVTNQQSECSERIAASASHAVH